MTGYRKKLMWCKAKQNNSFSRMLVNKILLTIFFNIIDTHKITLYINQNIPK